MWKNIDQKNSKHGHILCSEHLKKQVSNALVRKLLFVACAKFMLLQTFCFL